MIIVFSGTGNSLFVARNLSKALGDEIVSLPWHGGQLRPDNGRVIWVMPVYSWGMPPVVAKWMKTLEIEGGDKLPHFGVFTCGDDIGNTHFQWGRAAEDRDWQPIGEWSVQMPNTYVLMKGFDVDSPQLAKAKVEASVPRTASIAAEIKRLSDGFNAGGAPEPVVDVVRGKFAWIKTAIIYPWFKRFAMSPEPFFSNDRHRLRIMRPQLSARQHHNGEPAPGMGQRLRPVPALLPHLSAPRSIIHHGNPRKRPAQSVRRLKSYAKTD